MTAEGKEKIERSAARTAAVTRSSDVLEKVSEVWADLVASAVTASSDGSDRNEMEQPLIEMSKQLGFRRSPQPNAKDQMT